MPTVAKRPAQTQPKRQQHLVERPALTAHVLLEVNPKKAVGMIRELKAIPAVRGVYALSGSFDYLAIVETGSPHEIDEVVDRMGRVEGVEKTATSIVLSVKFERP